MVRCEMAFSRDLLIRTVPEALVSQQWRSIDD